MPVDSVLLPTVPASAAPTDVDLRELDDDHADHSRELSRKGSFRVVEVVPCSPAATFEDEHQDLEHEVDYRPVVLKEEDGLVTGGYLQRQGRHLMSQELPD